MPTNTLPTPDIKDVFFLAPHIVLTIWGLLVLMVDMALVRRKDPTERRNTIGRLSLIGVGVGLVAAAVVCFLPLDVRANPGAYESSAVAVDRGDQARAARQGQDGEQGESWGDLTRHRLGHLLGAKGVDYLTVTDPPLFFGTLSGDSQVAYFNIIYIGLLGLILWLSTAWSFTEEWGEYFALMFWATVGMMLLTASEELITLFITLETMTICLYLCTALEKSRRRSAEGGLKYFVYGSVSSALFLFGLSMLYGLTGTTYFDGVRQVLGITDRAVGGDTFVSGTGLAGNVAGGTAVLLMLVGFGFKVAAVPFHQWAPDAYEGAPAPVTAWIATGSKLASFVALMKVFVHALLPWSNPQSNLMGPGWLGIVAVIAAVTMTFGNFAALAQRNLKRMLAYSSIAHAGYILVGVAAASVAVDNTKATGAVLYYLIVYAFANVGAFAVAAWLVRDKKTDEIDDLNGLGTQEPLLAGCILILMLSLIGIPPLAGFFGKLYVFMEALDQREPSRSITLLWLVALGLFNSVVSAFYYVRVLKAMYLREPGERRLAPASGPIALPILLAAGLMIVFGILPDTLLLSPMQAAAAPMLTSVSPTTRLVPNPERDEKGNIVKKVLPPIRYGPEFGKGSPPPGRPMPGGAPAAAKAAGEAGTPEGPATRSEAQTPGKAGSPGSPPAAKGQAPSGPAAPTPAASKAAGPAPEKKASARP
jgi:NADH-quinone oxidoreductase subunit N